MGNDRPKHKCYEGEMFKADDLIEMLTHLHKTFEERQNEQTKCDCCDCECEADNEDTGDFARGMAYAYENVIRILIENIFE